MPAPPACGDTSHRSASLKTPPYSKCARGSATSGRARPSIAARDRGFSPPDGSGSREGVCCGPRVAHVARRHHEDDVLGDVGGVIAYALEVSRDQDEVQRRFDGGGVLKHEREQLPEHLRFQRVELIV